MNPDRWVRVHVIENIFEEDIIKDALDKEGIQYTVKEFKDTAYDGLFILQEGYATLFVRERDKEAVLAVLNPLKTMPYVAFSKD